MLLHYILTVREDQRWTNNDLRHRSVCYVLGGLRRLREVAPNYTTKYC